MATSHTPVSGVATLVYSPPAQGTPHVTLINEGAAVAYIGQAAVSVASGLPLYPRQQVSLPFAPIALYAVSGAVAYGDHGEHERGGELWCDVADVRGGVCDCGGERPAGDGGFGFE